MAKDIYFSSPQPGRNDDGDFTFEEIPAAAAPGAQRPARRAPAGNGSPAPAPTRGKKKKKKKHRFLKLVCFLLILTVGLGGGALYGYVLRDYRAAPLEENAYVNGGLMHDKRVYNILLMGVDTMSTSESTRSDAMILLSLDAVNGAIKLTSFMRDMYVSIPGYGDTKLTHACMYEGPQLTVDTIELNFGVDIDAYVKIGYDVFIELVDGVGGITVAEIDSTESWALAEENVYIDPGTNIHLNGEQAIKYVRIRHGQSDFARTERQREAITLIFGQAKKTNPLKLLQLARSIAGKVESSVPKSEFALLALRALRCVFHGVEQQQIPADGTWSDATRSGMAVLLVDFEANRNIIKNFIY